MFVLLDVVNKNTLLALGNRNTLLGLGNKYIGLSLGNKNTLLGLGKHGLNKNGPFHMVKQVLKWLTSPFRLFPWVTKLWYYQNMTGQLQQFVL